MKRLGIYVFYDKDGIVDDYISYFLDSFIHYFQEFIIVCNGNLTENGRRIFEKYTRNILICKDKGEVWGYKEGMNYFGWNTLKHFEEVILLNDTLMGPVSSFDTMFSDMENKELDFWGIFRKYSDKEFCFPEHIPSCFLAFRNRMIQSKEFEDYWEQLPFFQDQKQTTCQFETTFTNYFQQLEFQWDTYIDTSEMEKRHYAPPLIFPTELIIEKGCPVFIKQVFCCDYKWLIENTTGYIALKLYHFLQEFSNYPVDMILQHLLRTQNLANLYRCFHWNYILPTAQTVSKQISEIFKEKKIGLIVYSYYPDLVDTLIFYVNKLPPEVDVYFFTDTSPKIDNIKKHVERIQRTNVNFQLVMNRGRDLGSFLIGSREFIPQYDYIGFIHDKKSGHLEPATVGEGFFHKCLENMLSSTDYIYNVFQVFEENPRLGILSPSKPIHADFYQYVGKEWGENYDIASKLSIELNLHVPIEANLPPIAPFGDFFWFRPRALESLFNKRWEYEDFPHEPLAPDGTLLHAIERIYPFVAQEAGYYSGYITTIEYAEMEYTNWDYILGDVNNISHYCWSKWMEIENNVCWKITRPIRWISKMLKHHRRLNE
ncbi:MAG: rhamnan synthesis protein F [Lachnospiraceae bacterium]|nr:rhamnan synthesis protein F [Lachnospiraceae bacterium]